MKSLISVLALLLIGHPCYSQKGDKFSFVYKADKLEKVVTDVEKKFNIKYSFVDSIASGKRITLLKAFYSLEEINAKITEQTALKIIKIDNRFYSIVQEKAENPSKIYALEDVLVEGFLAKGINKTTQKVILYPQKVQTLPGVTDTDILLALQQLPGVKVRMKRLRDCIFVAALPIRIWCFGMAFDCTILAICSV